MSGEFCYLYALPKTQEVSDVRLIREEFRQEVKKPKNQPRDEW